MLNNFSIVRIIREIGLSQNHGLNLHELQPVEMNTRIYRDSELPEFERDLIEAGNRFRIIFLKRAIPPRAMETFLREQHSSELKR